MSQPVIKVPLKETNNQPGGREGSETKVMPGPVTKRTSGDLGQSDNSGGIFRATKGKPSSGKY